MNSAFRMIALCVLSAALLLSGCMAERVNTNPQLGTKPTVEDLFTAPATTVPIVATVPGGSESADTTQPNQSIDLGTIGLGIAGEYMSDSYGRYRVYEGGEMCIPIKLSATGQSVIDCAEQGIGILLFVDGQPQPYHIGNEGELTYFHIFHPEFDISKVDSIVPQKVFYDFYFTPVAGEVGETVELYATTIINPTWQSTDPLNAWRYTFGTVAVGTRILINTAPSKAEQPTVTERVNSVEIKYVDATFEELGGWSDEELIRKYLFAWYIDDARPSSDGFLYEYTARESVELRFEIWGTPYVRYGLVFYMDNQPITAQQEILFNMEYGKKTVVTGNIDLSDFDGECAIYAALVPRNAITTEIETDAYLHLSKTYFLLDDPKPAE